MKLTSRTSRAALAAFSLALFATACGGSEGAAPKADAAPKGPVNLTYWGWTGGAQQVVDAFNASHPNIKVTFSAITGGPDGYAKISNAIKAGNAPDVAGIEYPTLPEFVSQGFLEDITAPAGATVKAKFPQGVQDRVTLGGKTWAVPYDATPNLLYYRKDLFKKAGAEVPKTWDEYKAAAEKIKASDKNVRIGGWGNDDAPLLAALAWQAGAKWYGTEGDGWKVGINDAPSQKVASYWQGLVKDDLVMNLKINGPEFAKAKADGVMASFIGASWSAGGTMTALAKDAGKWGVAPLPHWGTPATGMFGGTSYAVTKGSKHVREAAEFATWAATSPEGVKARLSSLKTPSSSLPASPELRPIAAAAFDDKGFFGGDKVYEISGAQVDTIVPGWVWGPVQTATNTAIQDAGLKGTLTDGLAAGQAAAEAAIKGRGLNLAK
ncbi:ABC transporter substrate-binding protein [Streptomyces sp. NPDC002104]